MPKIPVLSGQEMIKALEKQGFIRTRQKGSHMILKKDNTGCVVPNHKELKNGTVLGILKQASIPLEDFIASL